MAVHFWAQRTLAVLQRSHGSYQYVALNWRFIYEPTYSKSREKQR